jgi:hypothetical protein
MDTMPMMSAKRKTTLQIFTLSLAEGYFILRSFFMMQVPSGFF